MALIRGEQITGSVASASFALTASYVTSTSTPYLIQSGSVSAQVNPTDTLFLIKSGSVNLMTITSTTTTINSDVFIVKDLTSKVVFKVSESVAYLPTQSSTLADSTAVAGGIYFTSSSFFVGLEN